MLDWLLIATFWCHDTLLLLVYHTLAFQTGRHVFLLRLVKQQHVGLLVVDVLLPGERVYPTDREPPRHLLLLHRGGCSLGHRVLAVTK